MPEDRANNTVGLYDTYQRIKGWDDEPFMKPNRGDVMFYDHYLSQLNLTNEKVVEVGFGNGNFLGWAKSRGALAYGTEVQDSAITKARANDVTVLPTDISESAPSLAGSVAAMAALDVMEHLTLRENEKLLQSAATMLRGGGLFLLRFPNGQSPLSLPIQYGDLTHLTVISIPIVSQLLIGLPLVVDYAGPPFKTVTSGYFGRIARMGQSALRRATDSLIRLTYGEIPMYANAVILLRRLET
jgi:SAM-dependent methyltransferase